MNILPFLAKPEPLDGEATDLALTTYPEGLDIVWIASDCDGRVAAFFTAGEGPVALAALRGVPLAIEYVEHAVFDLPASSEVSLLVRVPRPDCFSELARRGLHVYDWRDVHRPRARRSGCYEAVVVPLSPIDIADLPEALRSMASQARVSKAFARENSVDAAREFECLTCGNWALDTR